MSGIRYENGMEDQYPHAADVVERDVSENGFSAGWCMHAKPTPAYFFDFHVHYADRTSANVNALIQPDIKRAMALDVQRNLLIIRMYGKERPNLKEAEESMGDDSYSAEALRPLLEGLPRDEHVVLSAWPQYLSPEPALIHAAKDLGMRVIKLHNAPVIVEAAPADVWLSNAWQQCFQTMAKLHMPVLWHVTQRLPSSHYTGGGRNTYWKDGWKKGVSYGNEELLQVFLTCCQRHPEVNFVGAHQLHIGWERLDKLFAGHPNLYVDTTVGCQLKLGDSFYPNDKKFLRDVFIKWADRILFGTDTFWRGGIENHNDDVVQMACNFLMRLDLPEDVLNKVCHGNAERLTGLRSL